jgi:hypothetical protein
MDTILLLLLLSTTYVRYEVYIPNISNTRGSPANAWEFVPRIFALVWTLLGFQNHVF